MTNPNIIQLISLMSASRRHIRERFNNNRGLDPTTFTQVETLQFIMEQKEPKMKDIADSLNITPPSATSIINNLARAKMIERKTSDKDRRTVRLVITDKGKKYVTKCFKELAKEMEKNLIELNPTEQKQLLALHYKMFNVKNK